MKKTLFAVILLFVALSLASCAFRDGDGGQDQTSGGKGEYIWDVGSELFVVGSCTEFESELFSEKYERAVSEIFNTVGSYSAAKVDLSNDAGEPREHEIVIGYADREISRTAYRLLADMPIKDEANDVVVQYLIYSDGSSLAVAFTNHEENVAIDAAVDYFCEEFAKETLKLDKGIVKHSSFSMNEIHQERDDKIVADAWDELENKIVLSMTKSLGTEEAESYAEEMIGELKNLYSMYTDDLITWFAELYDPYICICEGECQKTRYCGGAGFYYSNSARDNEYTERDGVNYRLLPDAETTAQVMGFIKNSGMLDLVGGDCFSAFPEGEPERIVRFIKALQDEESGYFYHPQWLSMLGTAAFWDSRQSRDLTYSVSVLSCFGAKPTYKTPSGAEGDGILYDGTEINAAASASALTVPFYMSGAASVSRVVATGSVHPNLESVESFSAYLAGYDDTIASNSYYIGNELSSLASQIVARDKEIGTAEDPRPLATILDNWLRKHQDPETGHWHKTYTSNDYYATNGLLKISALYNTLKLPFPNPLPAARCAFEVITSEQPINHVCDLYNTWFVISNVTQNLKLYSDNEELAKSIIDEVRVDAINAVRVTAEKMITHRKADGSFSYYKDHSSQNSQNAPVAIPGSNEGDVNATVIFTYGIVGYMFNALDFGAKIPMFTDRDREVFRDIIAERVESCEIRKNSN